MTRLTFRSRRAASCRSNWRAKPSPKTWVSSPTIRSLPAVPVMSSRSDWASGVRLVAERGLPPPPVMSVVLPWVLWVWPGTLCQTAWMATVSTGGGGGGGGAGEPGDAGGGAAGLICRINWGGAGDSPLKAASLPDAVALTGALMPSTTCSLMGGSAGASAAAGAVAWSSACGARLGGGLGSAALLPEGDCAVRTGTSATTTLPTPANRSMATTCWPAKLTFRPGWVITRRPKSCNRCTVPSVLVMTRSVPDTDMLATEERAMGRFSVVPTGMV